MFRGDRTNRKKCHLTLPSSQRTGRALLKASTPPSPLSAQQPSLWPGLANRLEWLRLRGTGPTIESRRRGFGRGALPEGDDCVTILTAECGVALFQCWRFCSDLLTNDFSNSKSFGPRLSTRKVCEGSWVFMDLHSQRERPHLLILQHETARAGKPQALIGASVRRAMHEVLVRGHCPVSPRCLANNITHSRGPADGSRNSSHGNKGTNLLLPG